ncbi:MAG: flagellar biosynthesis protein FliQ [Rhodospirillales bacterium]|nr:flagellar biosynthesis protein FliQ [Rhodospirillales bacterium]MDH3792464.1 flagellar biosynthesis protein FliQ [Rhodospirillales bacterium]MDH3910756.1 flagellar biosynthesis protein FliQ [Rhodospirillales bacterium]MDH3916782.1 flagellar biosynthesis protein FliQ [Rhodospirillales bacterium]MDH3966717.1 flagellar biosynthesis protein FliQ [Rhodospirillales bacterium]
MNATDVLEVSREAVIVMLKVGAPILSMALLVGLAVALFQALTQIQEMTLSFVPKILVIFVSLLVLMPFMLSTMTAFGQSLMDRIVALG